jgi:hypothetical protein
MPFLWRISFRLRLDIDLLDTWKKKKQSKTYTIAIQDLEIGSLPEWNNLQALENARGKTYNARPVVVHPVANRPRYGCYTQVRIAIQLDRYQKDSEGFRRIQKDSKGFGGRLAG